MAKVVLWSPVLWHHGAYAKNMLNLGLRLIKAGHEVINFALTGLMFGKVQYPVLECQDCEYKIPGDFNLAECPRCKGTKLTRYIINVLPNNGGDYGQTWLPRWNQLEGPFNVVILHYDAWALGDYHPPPDINLYYMTPIDHSPVPPPLAQILKAGGKTICFTKWAEEEFKKGGISSIVIPHCIDDKIYLPGDKIEARRKLELPEDCFLITSVAANSGPRKNLGNLLRAFKDFLDKVPRAKEKAFLMLHTNIVSGPGNPSGYNLPLLWNNLGIAERIKHTHPIYYEALGFTDLELCQLYQASDWTILVSLGEGFGIPLIESLACKTPVIFSNFSSCPEVVGPGGLPVEATDRIPFELSSSFQWIPKTEQITERLIQVYEDWEAGGKLRDELGEEGLQHVKENYTWDKIMPLWLDVVEGRGETKEMILEARSAKADREVDIIVITHNHLELLNKCINSVYENTTIPFHLIIVDDQSTDNTKDYCESLWEKRDNLTYIRPKNKCRGGSQVMNIGYKHCRNDFIVSMNNDIVATKGWLEEAIKVMESDEKIGIVGMKFLYPDDTIQHAGGTFIKTGLPYHLGIGEPREAHSEIREVKWVSGPCVLLRRQCLEPGWDEAYDTFGGHEDVDLCLRARRDEWKVVYCGKSEVYHLEGATVLSIPNFGQMHLRSREIFLNRWSRTPWVK